jgi:RNA polymerase sigma-54 factor
VSFGLEMAMAPRVGLEVSPALVAFSEMLILPCSAMEDVVENELCTNAALERFLPSRPCRPESCKKWANSVPAPRCSGTA